MGPQTFSGEERGDGFGAMLNVRRGPRKLMCAELNQSEAVTQLQVDIHSSHFF